MKCPFMTEHLLPNSGIFSFLKTNQMNKSVCRCVRRCRSSFFLHAHYALISTLYLSQIIPWKTKISAVDAEIEKWNHDVAHVPKMI